MFSGTQYILQESCICDSAQHGGAGLCVRPVRVCLIPRSGVEDMVSDELLLTIVVPAYNEAKRLPGTLASIASYFGENLRHIEIIVVDDGSQDDTAEIAVQYPGTCVLRCDHRGKGFAVRAGALAARGTYVLICDADLAVPIAAWECLRAELDRGQDIAIGSREGLGARRQGEPWYRRFMGRTFNVLVCVIALRGIQDTQCGFKALRRSVAVDLFQRMRLYGGDAPLLRSAAVTAYDVELLFLAQYFGYSIAEVPVEWRYGEETRVHPLRDSIRNLRDLLRLRRYAWQGAYDTATEHGTIAKHHDLSMDPVSTAPRSQAGRSVL